MSDKRVPNMVILDIKNSPHALLKPISIHNISLDDGFWKSRVSLNQTITLQTQYQMLETTGRIDNFLRVSKIISKPFTGYVFNDSDVYKWLEAAAWTMAYRSNDTLEQQVEYLIGIIESAQDNNGYLNSYFSLENSSRRWTNLKEKHELYCAGHLIQAAIAHYRVTGKARLLDIAIRFADHIYQKFGPNGQKGLPGHPEIEMALIELYRVTSTSDYLTLAKLFIDRRGYGLLGGSEYLIDHRPFHELRQLAGHAVRALYLCCGVADLYLESGEKELYEALVRLWTRMTSRQMYITGGVGSRYDGEALGEEYELPNTRAYAETCAAIANVMWNWRMFQIDGNAVFADLLEWTLFNAVLPGISLDGQNYFYENSLQSMGDHQRKPWFECACCPPNVCRTIAMFPGLIYSLSEQGLWINQFTASSVRFEPVPGQPLSLRQRTNYPWDGQVSIELLSATSTRGYSHSHNEFSLFIRMPGWLGTSKAIVTLNNTNLENKTSSGAYLEIHRNWTIGDVVVIEFPMEVKYIEAHPYLTENFGKLTMTRGPLVYCAENIDNPEVDLRSLVIDPLDTLKTGCLSDLLNGIKAIDIPAYVSVNDEKWDSNLYQLIDNAIDSKKKRIINLRSIPYFAWANRRPGQMQVWHRFTRTSI